jgi:hypothetical protein
MKDDALLFLGRAGRVLAVLGAAGAGFCAGLTSILMSRDQTGWSASPSGYGGRFADLVRDAALVALPLALLGAAIGAWLGFRLSRTPRSRFLLAIGSALVGLASIAAVMSL